MPVIALDDDRERATQVLEAEIRTAIREDFINSVVLGCAGMVHMTDNQIAVDADSVAALQKRVDAANQDITDIRSQMSSKFKPLLEFQNVSNQVFALELTIDGLDKEIDNLGTFLGNDDDPDDTNDDNVVIIISCAAWADICSIDTEELGPTKHIILFGEGLE